MIETRLLRQFIAVAQELNFHRAAIRLHMAQPPLSQAINRLEDKLGFSLFTRDKREVRLTVAGADFLDTAHATLQTLEQGVEQARKVAKGMAGSLTVTAISIAGYPFLLHSLKAFRQAYPQVQLIIREMPSAEQAKALLTGDSDLAFMRQLPLPGGHLASRLILDEPLLLALPRDHALAAHSEVQLQDCAQEDFVFTPQVLGSGYHAQLIALCESAGFYPRIVQEAAQIQTLLGLVACGFGVALVPQSFAASGLRDELVLRPLAPVSQTPNPGIGLYMNWNRLPASIPLQNLQALLEQHLPPAAG